MNKPLDASAIPCIVLTFTPDEMEIVKKTLEDEGYEDDLKQWILDMMNMEAVSGEPPSRYAGAADRVIGNVSDFVMQNPETIKAATRLAGTFINRVIKKGPHP